MAAGLLGEGTVVAALFLRWERFSHMLILWRRRREGKIDRTSFLEVGGKGIHSTGRGISLIWTVVHVSHVPGGKVGRTSMGHVKVMGLDTRH